MSSPSSAVHMLRPPLALGRVASQPTSKNPFLADPQAPFQHDLRPKSMANPTV